MVHVMCQGLCTDTSVSVCVISVSCTGTFQLLPMLMMSSWATAAGGVAQCINSIECTLEAVWQCNRSQQAHTQQCKQMLKWLSKRARRAVHSGHDSAVLCDPAGKDTEALTTACSDMDTRRELLLSRGSTVQCPAATAATSGLRITSPA